MGGASLEVLPSSGALEVYALWVQGYRWYQEPPHGSLIKVLQGGKTPGELCCQPGVGGLCPKPMTLNATSLDLKGSHSDPLCEFLKLLIVSRLGATCVCPQPAYRNSKLKPHRTVPFPFISKKLHFHSNESLGGLVLRSHNS